MIAIRETTKVDLSFTKLLFLLISPFQFAWKKATQLDRIEVAIDVGFEFMVILFENPLKTYIRIASACSD